MATELELRHDAGLQWQPMRQQGTVVGQRSAWRPAGHVSAISGMCRSNLGLCPKLPQRACVNARRGAAHRCRAGSTADEESSIASNACWIPAEERRDISAQTPILNTGAIGAPDCRPLFAPNKI